MPEHWSALPFPSSGDLPNPGIKPASLMHTLASAGKHIKCKSLNENTNKLKFYSFYSLIIKILHPNVKYLIFLSIYEIFTEITMNLS